MLRGNMDHALSDNANLNIHLGVGYDFMTDDSSVTSSYAGGGSTFVTKGIEPESVVVRGGIGVDVLTSNNLTVIVSYDVEGREDYINQAVLLKLRFPLK